MKKNINQEKIIKENNIQIPLSNNLIKNYNETIAELFKNQKFINAVIDRYREYANKVIEEIESYMVISGTIEQLNLDCLTLINVLDNIEDSVPFSKLNHCILQ